MPTGADFSSLAVDPAFALPPGTAECPDWTKVPMYLMSGWGTRADPFLPMPGYSPFNVPARAGREYIQPQAPPGWYRHPNGSTYAWHVLWWRDGTDVRVTPVTGSGLGGSEGQPLPSLESLLAIVRSSVYGVPVGSPILPGYYFRHLAETFFYDVQGQVWDARGNLRTQEVLPPVEGATVPEYAFYGAGS